MNMRLLRWSLIGALRNASTNMAQRSAPASVRTEGSAKRCWTTSVEEPRQITPKDLTEFDRDLISAKATWTRDLALTYASLAKFHPLWRTMGKIKQFSMLGAETLLMCRGYALAARSGILEIGAYIGGSTVALGMGLDAAGRKPMVTIDCGGSFENQPYLPSKDIHADWRKNCAKCGLPGISTLIDGWAHEEATINAAKAAAGNARFDLLFIDADGEVTRVLENFADRLTDDCLLIVDDYFNVLGGQEKVDVVARQVNQLLAEGIIEQYVLTPFSTWFGRLAKRSALIAKTAAIAR